jgi:hypothetical protein
MGDPKNASINADGFRIYQWVDALTGAETDVLSVTSIRKLCGEPYRLVQWQIANVIDAVLGTQKRTVIGPRGGIKDVRQVWEFPSEFARMYDATEGRQDKVDEAKKWLRDTADEPRNIGAVRGSMAHHAIEDDADWTRIERPFVVNELAKMVGSGDHAAKARLKKGVSDEDVSFVRNAVRQYWDMRAHVPFVIIAREVQVFNLTAGYAGSFDALAWMLPDDWGDRPIPKASTITLAWVKEHGGGTDQLVLLDWKTSKGVYTDQIVQCHAYLSAEFVGSDGVRDRRLTELLLAAHTGGLVHIRPNAWAVHLFGYTEEVVRAFLGSVAFARFLAKYPEPEPLFTETIKGESQEADE